MIMDGSKEFEKEEMLLLFISLLIEQYGQLFENCISECSEEIEDACAFMTEHFAEHITLENLCKCSGLSKSTLLCVFTKSKGVTPYRYLQTIRIGKAKELLEQGISSVDAAIQTHFQGGWQELWIKNRSLHSLVSKNRRKTEITIFYWIYCRYDRKLSYQF